MNKAKYSRFPLSSETKLAATPIAVKMRQEGQSLEKISSALFQEGYKRPDGSMIPVGTVANLISDGEGGGRTEKGLAYRGRGSRKERREMRALLDLTLESSISTEKKLAIIKELL